MMKTLKTFLRDESGVTAIEYGLIAALVSLAIIAAATSLGTKIGDLFNRVGTKVDTVTVD